MNNTKLLYLLKFCLFINFLYKICNYKNSQLYNKFIINQSCTRQKYKIPRFNKNKKFKKFSFITIASKILIHNNFKFLYEIESKKLKTNLKTYLLKNMNDFYVKFCDFLT